MSNKTKIFIVLAIIFLAAGSRLIDHPYNFTPIAAMAIFAGCYLKKKWGLIFPLAAMFISDYFIGFYDWRIMAAVYLSMVFAYFIGWILSSKIKWQNVVFASLAASLAFFFITNFAVWFFGSWYPHNLSGLASCFVLALPFFRNTLAGDLFYAGALFGAYSLVLYLLPKASGALRPTKHLTR